MPRKPAWPPPVYPNPRDGVERMRIRVNGRPHDIILGPIGSPEAKAEYVRQLSILESRGYQTDAAIAPHASMTVEAVVAEFFGWALAEHGEKWGQLPKYKEAARPLLTLYGDRPAHAFDAEALLVVQRAMATGSWMDATRKAEHLARGWAVQWCRSVVNARVSRIKTIWRWAEQRKFVPASAYHNLQTVRAVPANAAWCRETERRKPTKRADLEAVMARCPPPVAAMLELQWISGMRSAEIRVMKAGEIDRTGEVWLYLLATDKNSWRGAPTAPVALGPECQRILTPWLDAAPDGSAYLFRPLLARRTKGGDAQPSPPDRCYSDYGYAQAVRRACDAAGVKIIPYGGRHAAKQRITREAGLDAARAVLRQKSIVSTTFYGELDVEHAKDVMGRLG